MVTNPDRDRAKRTSKTHIVSDHNSKFSTKKKKIKKSSKIKKKSQNFQKSENFQNFPKNLKISYIFTYH